MHPDHIDYTIIDSPLRKLILTINKSSWAKTIGSCAGKACHDNRGFYLIIEVKGIEGVHNLLKWLSLSHALGYNARYKDHTIPDYALPEAEISFPNRLHGDDSITGTLMGEDWIRFYIRLHLGGKPLNKTQTRGGIKALTLGWNAITNNYKKKRKSKENKSSIYSLTKSAS